MGFRQQWEQEIERGEKGARGKKIRAGVSRKRGGENFLHVPQKKQRESQCRKRRKVLRIGGKKKEIKIGGETPPWERHDCRGEFGIPEKDEYNETGERGINLVVTSPPCKKNKSIRGE